MCFFFVLENTCDYHQNHAYNSSTTAEQTLIGTSIVRVLYDYLIKYLSCFLFNLPDPAPVSSCFEFIVHAFVFNN